MSTLSPTGTGRRSPVPVILAVVVGLAIAFVGGWWFAGRSDGVAAAGPSSSSSCSAHATTSGSHASATRSSGTASGKPSTVKPAALPDPRTIKVNVYNATKHRGLAKATSAELAARGFGIGAVANDPLNKVIQATAEIRYGPGGAAAARVVAAQVPNPAMVVDKRKNATVDFVLGEQYSSLNTPAQAQALLTAAPVATSSPC
jgi:hypothetical protein